MGIHREKLQSDNAKKFSKTLDAYNASLESFIKLYNLWIEMTVEEREECIDNLLWQSE